MSYRNWQAICKIPDTHFMWALALLDLATDFGQSVVERLPEYFTDELQQGPIPMSVLRMQANEGVMKATGGECGVTDALVFRGSTVHELPLIRFAVASAIAEYPHLGFQLIPKELESAETVGKVYKWQGKDIVLLECIEGSGEWTFTPAECVALDR